MLDPTLEIFLPARCSGPDQQPALHRAATREIKNAKAGLLQQHLCLVLVATNDEVVLVWGFESQVAFDAILFFRFMPLSFFDFPIFCFRSFLWFNRAAGFLPPQPQFADVGARRTCQGWPLFSGHRRLGLYMTEHDGRLVGLGRRVPPSVQVDDFEGSPHSQRKRSRRQPCIRWAWMTRTMMHVDASVAKLRGGRPNLHNGMRAKVSAGPRHLEPSSAIRQIDQIEPKLFRTLNPERKEPRT